MRLWSDLASMRAAILVFGIGWRWTTSALRLLQIESVSACGTGAVATMSRLVLGFPVCRVPCRFILKWRRLLTIMSDRHPNVMPLERIVRALKRILSLFDLSRVRTCLCLVVGAVFARSV